jgi:hypothetical protein
MPPATPDRRTVLSAGTALAAGALLPACRAAAAPPDDAQALQALIDRGAVVPRSAAPYLLDRPLIVARSGPVLFEGGTRLRWIGPPASVRAKAAVIDVVADGVTVASQGPGGLQVEAARPDPWLWAVQASGVADLAVRDVQASDCLHVRTFCRRSDRWADVSLAPGARDTCRNVSVTGGGARFAQLPTEGQEGACCIRYTFDWRVEGATYQNVPQGVQWWGGNAYPVDALHEGVPGNARKCARFRIARVTVRDARIAGIWGSMGQDGEVVDCTVERCGDVGFDAEGSWNVAFTRCRATDAVNGAFAVFFLSRDIAFIDCTGLSTRRDWPLFRMWNITQSSAGTGAVAIRGGRFRCTDPAGPGTIDTAGGPTALLEVAGATLENVRIDTAANNMHRTRIVGNRLSFPAGLGGRAAIRVGGSHLLDGRPGRAEVLDNVVALAGPAEPGSVAVAVYEDDYNGAASGLVRGNRVSGPFAVLVEATGASRNGMRPTLTVEGNSFASAWPGPQPLRVAREHGGPAPAVTWRGNVDGAGRPLG